MTTEYICRLVDSESQDVMVFRPLRPLIHCEDCGKSMEPNGAGCYCRRFKQYMDPKGFCSEAVGRPDI